jgi:MoxR-like ATPase
MATKAMTRPMTSPTAAANTIQAKFALARSEMGTALIERRAEVDLILTALICQEHPLLVGPPGTGKSLLLDSLLAWMGQGAKRFSILFTKFTTPEEVFGPISVAGLKADVYRRVTTGKLPEADVGFADEIFKASSAILNTMLRILNERVYENGDGTFGKCPLKICLAASNEWPGDQEGGKELGALFDRFLFRKTVKPIATKAGRQRLLWNRDHRPKLTTTITPAEIDQAHAEAMALPFSDRAKDAFEKILAELATEGIQPGDRRCFKSVAACQAFAYLSGAAEVTPDHLEILAHTLWDDPAEQPAKCAKVVGKVANPIGMAIMDKVMQAEELFAKCEPRNVRSNTETVTALQIVQKELDRLPDDSRRDKAAKYVGQQIATLYRAMVGAE